MNKAVLVKLQKEYEIEFDTLWSSEDEVLVFLDSEEYSDVTIDEGKLLLTIDFSDKAEGVYNLVALNETLATTELLGRVIVVNMNGVYPIMNALASELQKIFSSEDRSILNLDFEAFLLYLYSAYSEWGYERTKPALSNRFLITESSIKILSAILDRVLNRDILETPELKVDDSKLVSRIMKRLEKLSEDKNAQINQLFPEIAAELLTQPKVDIDVTSVFKNRHGVSVPLFLNQAPTKRKFTVVPSEGKFLLTWDVSYLEDFLCYKVYSVTNNVSTLHKTFFNNLNSSYTLEVTGVDRIVLETYDSGGLFCAESFTVETPVEV